LYFLREPAIIPRRPIAVSRFVAILAIIGGSRSAKNNAHAREREDAVCGGGIIVEEASLINRRSLDNFLSLATLPFHADVYMRDIYEKEHR